MPLPSVLSQQVQDELVPLAVEGLVEEPLLVHLVAAAAVISNVAVLISQIVFVIGTVSSGTHMSQCRIA